MGVIALGMPVVLGLGGLLLGQFRSALSAYYYEPIVLGDFFVRCLIAIGALLMAYRGWTPKVAQLATLAGLAAIAVALVPMEGWVVASGVALYPDAGYWVHAGAAGILFAILSFFCLFVFTKVPMDTGGGLPALSLAKRRRNLIYRSSGIIIAVSAIAIGAGDLIAGGWWNARNMTFWMEALILAAFGTSWLTQGRILDPLSDPRDREDAAIAKEQIR